nr:hypothetical protein [Tanacetum cinerariifolium]
SFHITFAMSTQQDIYAAGSENRPPMLNKENYVPWSSRLLQYAKSRPNEKLIHNSIINGPYVRRMIPEPGDTNREVLVNETFHVQTDDELTEKELKQIEADEIWLRVQQMMKGSNIEIQNYMQQPMPNPEDITDPTTAMNMALALMAKAFKLNYSTPTNNNQMISSNPRNRQIAQPGMNMGQDRQMQMVGVNGENQFRQYARQNKEEAGIQLQAEEFDLMAAAADLDEVEEVNENCILMANLQQASTSSTQTDKAPVYDSDGSAEEAAKFVGDFKSLAKEADESVAKHKALELEIERLLRAVVSQNIMSVVQKASVVDTSNLQTELERTKERFENCIIKKENEYAKL